MDRQAELEQHIVWIDGALAGAEPGAVANLLRERRLTLDHLAGLGSQGRWLWRRKRQRSVRVNPYGKRRQPDQRHERQLW